MFNISIFGAKVEFVPKGVSIVDCEKIKAVVWTIGKTVVRIFKNIIIYVRDFSLKSFKPPITDDATLLIS